MEDEWSGSETESINSSVEEEDGSTRTEKNTVGINENGKFINFLLLFG